MDLKKVILQLLDHTKKNIQYIHLSVYVFFKHLHNSKYLRLHFKGDKRLFQRYFIN